MKLRKATELSNHDSINLLLDGANTVKKNKEIKINQKKKVFCI